MKSKAEILKAVDTCVHIDRSCSECPYCDDTKDCVNHLVADFRAILNKSDFEVMEEIFGKSNKTLCGAYIAANGHHVLEIHPRLDDDYRAVIRFDEEDNIL